MADDSDDELASVPPCMPSPDAVIQIVDSIFGGGDPVRKFTFMTVKIILSLHSLIGVVLLCSACGGTCGPLADNCPMRALIIVYTSTTNILQNVAAFMEVPVLALPAELEQLAIVAGEVAGLDAHSARVCVPTVAGLGELVAITAFWSGWPRLELLATWALMFEFVCVACVHALANQAVHMPIVFVGLATIKIATTSHSRVKMD